MKQKLDINDLQLLNQKLKEMKMQRPSWNPFD